MAEERVQRRLAAILAADVVGFSRLMESDEPGTLATLKARRRDVLLPLVAKHQGRIFKVTGDGVLVEFASAVNAVQCAVDFQQGMAAANAGEPNGKQIVLRVGINLADVMVEGDDLYGDGINVAARLEAIAEPGGILASAAAYDHVRNKLAVAFEDLGAQTLKNIAEPVRAYRVAGTPVVAVAATGKASDKPSIAVLPFTNMSGDPEQEFFSDGITEDIITELSRFRSLFVIARNSSFQYRGANVDVRQAARELGVQYIAEGSVRRAGNRVRVTAQLIDARTGSHLWADHFDRELADIFAVQDEVARRIVTSVAPVLAAESLQLAKRKPPEDIHAYDCFLKAKVLVDSPRTFEDLREGRALCDRAIQIDPAFVRAHAYRSLSYTVGVMMIEVEDLSEWRRQALLSAEKAVELDAMDAWSHWALAEASLLNGQKDRSRAHMARAIALNPNDADVLAISAYWHACLGEHDLSSQYFEMAMERNPSNPSWYNWARGGMHYMSGRYAEALAAFEFYGQPNASIHRWRAAILIKLERPEEARKAMQALLELRPDLTVAKARKIFDYVPNCDDLVETLRQAGLPR